MSDHARLIGKKIEHLRRMRTYLDYSLGQTHRLVPIRDWQALTPAQHQTLAAFRIRFSEFQEQLDKTMRAEPGFPKAWRAASATPPRHDRSV